MYRKRFFAIAIAIILIAAILSGCDKLSETVDKIFSDYPTSEDTYTSVLDVNLAMLEKMENGETEMTFNIAGASENDLKHIADNMNTFWGVAEEYTINGEFDEVDGVEIPEGGDVKNVTAKFRLSNNYYVYRNILNSEPIPEEYTNAKEIAAVLPVIADEIFAGAGGSDFELALAVHDWLVANVTYDDTIIDASDLNGSYGALIKRQTMCQGYAEAFALILKCYTNVEVQEVVGDARDIVASGAQDETETDVPQAGARNPFDSDSAFSAEAPDPPGGWVGHAWNIVKIDGEYYHVDATFDDPEGNRPGDVLRYYFGQNDDVMETDHRWAKGYHPECVSEDFYYFRKSGLFADGFDAFQQIVTALVDGQEPAIIQVATVGVELTQDNIQFIFKTNDRISEILWSERIYGDVCVQTIEPQYG